MKDVMKQINVGLTRGHTGFRIGLILALSLLSACGMTPGKKLQPQSSTDEILRMLDEDIASNGRHPTSDIAAVPSEVTQALMPPVRLDMNIGTEQDTEQRFDLSAENTPIQIFLMSLVKGTPYNMVVHPSVKGDVSINLKNVTVAEAMEVMRRVYGYDYRRTAMGYEVSANELQTRIFKIDYLNVERSGSSQIHVASGQITDSSRDSNGNKSDTTKSSGKPSKSQNGDNIVTSGSLINTRSRADFWHELSEAIKTFIPAEGERKVVVNPQSGVVVVRAMPSELHDIESYLEQTQLIVKRQVILEAKILEVELNEGFQTGINWAALSDGKGDTALFGQTGGGTIFNGTGVTDIVGNSGVLDPNAFTQIQGTNASAFGGVFSLALKVGDFAAFIEALETQGDVHVLSSPRVSTVNNQKAVIKVGSDEFFVTGISTETLDSGGTLQQSVNVELTPFFSGVALDVTPQINEANVVTLHVHPSVSDIHEKVKQIDISLTDSLNVPLASSTIRESDSIVSAKSGQVIVIGGLMQNVTQDARAGVPLLGRLPFIGGLFRHEKQSVKKSELVILLKPVVVDNDEEWTRQIKQSREAVNDIAGVHYDSARRVGKHPEPEMTGE